VLITDKEDLKKIEEILPELPDLELVIVTEGDKSDAYNFFFFFFFFFFFKLTIH
jgi:hypothetical protein